MTKTETIFGFFILIVAALVIVFEQRSSHPAQTLAVGIIPNAGPQVTFLSPRGVYSTAAMGPRGSIEYSGAAQQYLTNAQLSLATAAATQTMYDNTRY